MKGIDTKVIAIFGKTWRTTPDVISRAPGRINIIGEHVDYTGGYVLPAAINRSIIMAAKRTPDKKIRGYSVNFLQEASCTAGNYDKQHPALWFRYVLGVMYELEKSGYRVPAYDFCLGGDIPIGAGLSSSAALGMVVLTAIEGLTGQKIGDKEASLICQRAENNFVGVNCGIMDMLVSRVARINQAVLVDCTNLTWRGVDVTLPGFEWIVIDSGKKRELASSAYNTRVRECENALAAARRYLHERKINNLRDVTVRDLALLAPKMDDTVYRRLKHVVTENARVRDMVTAFERSDIDAVGRLLYASHISLRDDYEVSCAELDQLIGILSGMEGVCGARMTGAGFGGCIIALIETNVFTQVKNRIDREYHPAGLDKPEATILRIKFSGGAGLVAML